MINSMKYKYVQQMYNREICDTCRYMSTYMHYREYCKTANSNNFSSKIESNMTTTLCVWIY